MSETTSAPAAEGLSVTSEAASAPAQASVDVGSFGGGTINSDGSISVSNTRDTSPAATAAPSFADLVPDEYKSAPWLQGISKSENPIHALFKSYAGAQDLIGRKGSGVEIPGENASEDVIKNFRKAIGAPDNADGYTIAALDLSKESEAVQNYLKADSEDDSYAKAMKEAANAAHLSDKQFGKLAKAADEWKLGYARDVVAAQEQAKANQLKAFNDHYGDNADAVHAAAKEVAAKILPPEIASLNDPEIALIEVLRLYNEKVYKNDGIRSGGAPSQNGPTIREQILATRATEAFKNPMHPGHRAAQDKVNALYVKEVESEKRS